MQKMFTWDGCCREDAQAIMQLFLKHIKGNPAEMTYDELVEYETLKMMATIPNATSE